MIQSRGKGPSQRVRGPNLRKVLILFLARPRELRGRMCKGLVLIKSPHLTQREADGGESPRFLGGFLALGWSAPPQQTHAVGWHAGPF